MNNILRMIETTEYSIEDYYNIIDLCEEKILKIEHIENNKVFLNNLKNINIKNEELKFFFDIIYSSFILNIDRTKYNEIKTIIISFDYKNNSIDLIVYCDEDDCVFIEEKIHIVNKLTHKYETFFTNCEDKLIDILELITINKKEINEFIKKIFECVPVNIL